MTVFQFHFRLTRMFWNGPHLYLTCLGNIRDEFEISIEIPRKDQSPWRFINQHRSPGAFRAVLIVLIPAPTGAWCNDYRNDRAPSNMRLLRRPFAQILG